jgi:hypothetical protein
MRAEAMILFCRPQAISSLAWLQIITAIEERIQWKKRGNDKVVEAKKAYYQEKPRTREVGPQ